MSLFPGGEAAMSNLGLTEHAIRAEIENGKTGETFNSLSVLPDQVRLAGVLCRKQMPLSSLKSSRVFISSGASSD